MSPWCFAQGVGFVLLWIVGLITVALAFAAASAWYDDRGFALPGPVQWLLKGALVGGILLLLGIASYQAGEQICKHGWNIAQWDKR